MANTLLRTVQERIASDTRFRKAVEEGWTIRQLHELVGVHLFGRASIKRARQLVLNKLTTTDANRNVIPGKANWTTSRLPGSSTHQGRLRRSTW